MKSYDLTDEEKTVAWSRVIDLAESMPDYAVWAAVELITKNIISERYKVDTDRPVA